MLVAKGLPLPSRPLAIRKLLVGACDEFGRHIYSQANPEASRPIHSLTNLFPCMPKETCPVTCDPELVVKPDAEAWEGNRQQIQR